MYCDCAGIWNPKDRITKVKAVNTVVQYVSIRRLHHELQIVDEPKPVKRDSESGGAQDKDKVRMLACHSDEDWLLSIPDLEYISLATWNRRQLGKENPFPDSVDTLYGMHALQSIVGLMFNRVQVHKNKLRQLACL